MDNVNSVDTTAKVSGAADASDAVSDDTPPGANHAVPGWFDISTPDSARTRQFYSEMFGWTVHALDDNYALVGAPGQPPTGGIGQAGPDAPYVGVVAYFTVDDVDTALERAEKLGGRRRLEPQSIPGRGRLAVFTDPDGNPVGLLSS